jgi:multidrug efflux system membrane fusion protein
LTDSTHLRKAVLLVLALAVGGAIAWRLWTLSAEATAPPNAKKPSPPVPVLVARAVVRDVPVTLKVVGRAEAYESVTLMSRLDGQVAAVEYKEGRHVRSGQVLVRLDPSDYRARLRQAQADQARDQAQLAKARADLDRYAALAAQGFISHEALEQYRTAAIAAEATVKADKAAVDLARLQLGYTVIRAPFDGLVGARLVFPGTAVKTNETALAVVNRVRPLYVSFAVPERYLSRVRGDLAKSPLPVTVAVPGEHASAFAGEAHFLNNAVDPATGTIQMKAVLPNTDEHLTPGQFLDVSLRLETLHHMVTVPAEAVQQGPSGAFVYVVRPDRTTEVRPVQVAVTHQGLAAVAQGLQAGETVVTDGYSRLTPGAVVKAKGPQASGTGPAIPDP